MDKLTDIAHGWTEFIKGRPYTRELMNKRLAICDTCPNKRQMTGAGKIIVQLINDKANTFKCGECGCPLSALCANPSSKCKLGKWLPAGEESYY